MQLSTVLLIILAAVVAMVIVLFQYFHKPKNKGKLRIVLSFLRFLALFCVFLLLINPKLSKYEITLEKSNLILLVDDSSSMDQTSDSGKLTSIIQSFKNSTEINNKFGIQQYGFGESLKNNDSLSFNEPRTDISNALKSLNKIYGGTNDVVVLMSDGNSTIGEDYEFYAKNQKLSIYPIVIGDTTSYEDLVINQVNANKYAFLKNKFPVEVFVSYTGDAEVKSNLSISVDGKKVFSQLLELNNTNNSITVNTLLEASSVGLKNIQINLGTLANEKNTFNNKKNISVEVIDEKTNIAIITDLLHPDIGAIKKSIESNEQRAVTIYRPETNAAQYADIDLFILYQPNSSFKSVFDYLSKSNSNTFTISGPGTDWRFLSSVQNSYTKNNYAQTEEVTPVINTGFSVFDVSDLSVENYPPLETNLGEVVINVPHETLFFQKIKGTEINEPLLAILTNDLERDAILFGQNIWKWRVQGFREHQNFKDFDDLIGKIILYLSTDAGRSRLVLEYESLYQGNTNAKIVATYFDETYSFDANASISLRLKEVGNSEVKELPMLLKGNYYEADIGNLKVGDYSFEVRVADTKLSKTGSFGIMDYDVEQQFTSSNYKKLNRLAQNTNGSLYFSENNSGLINDLLAEDKFTPIRKSRENVVSLVDFRFLLAMIIAALSIEWFIRKYNGLT